MREQVVLRLIGRKGGGGETRQNQIENEREDNKRGEGYKIYLSEGRVLKMRIWEDQERD